MKKVLLSCLCLLGLASASAETVITYEKTDFSALSDGDKVIIVDTNKKVAMQSKTATAKSKVLQIAVDISEDGNQLTGDFTAADLVFTLEEATDGVKFKNSDNNYLYTLADNNGVRISTANNVSYVWTWSESGNNSANWNYLKTKDPKNADRYLGAYSSSTANDWRAYTSVNTNINTTKTAFFKEVKTEIESDPEAPAFTTQPVDASYYQGATATALTVVATGYPAPTYQWYSNTTNSTEDATEINGATSASYTPSTANVGTTYYYCVATNENGTATSNIAAIEVNALVLAGEGEGTLASPYTVARALDILSKELQTEDNVYVSGTVSAVTDLSSQYSNATYNISDNGNAANELTVFRGKLLNNDYSEGAIQAGDRVVVMGKLINYVKDGETTPELASGNELISLDRPTVPADELGNVLVSVTNDSEDGIVDVYSGEKLTIFCENADYIIVGMPEIITAEEWDMESDPTDDQLVATFYQAALFAGDHAEITFDSNIGMYSLMGAYGVRLNEGESIKNLFADYAEMFGWDDVDHQLAEDQVAQYEFPEENEESMFLYNVVMPSEVEFSIADNTEVAKNTTLTISCEKAQKISYTVNGGDAVVVNGATATINLTEDCTIAAFGVFGNLVSETVSASYTIAPPSYTMLVSKYTEEDVDTYFAVSSEAGGATSSLAAVEVTVENGKVLVSDPEGLDNLLWIFEGNNDSAKLASKNGKYVKISKGDVTLDDESKAVEWSYDSSAGYWKNGDRTLVYRTNNGGIFKNYAVSNINTSSYGGAAVEMPYLLVPTFSVEPTFTHIGNTTYKMDYELTHSNYEHVRHYEISVIKVVSGAQNSARRAEGDIVLGSVNHTDMSSTTGSLTISGLNESDKTNINVLIKAVMNDDSEVDGGTRGHADYTYTVDTADGTTTGIEGIEAEGNGAVEFYNLQGVRVENPTAGLYIMRQGSKAVKVLVK